MQEQDHHPSICDAIERLLLEDPRHQEDRRKLIADGHLSNGDLLPVDRQSLEFLVDFLDNRGLHEVTELGLHYFRLPHPSDGGLDVLRSFFAQSDTTLTKVTLICCDFGSQEEASQLLAAFETNRTVSDLTVRLIVHLEDAALGNSLSSLMQNMPQLQRLDCSGVLRVNGVRAFQPALQANRTLRELTLSCNLIGDDGIRLIADALVGNTTIEALDISSNEITSNGVVDITRLIESTRLHTLYLEGNLLVYHDDNDANQHLITILHKNTTIQKLRMPRIQIAATIICARNKSLVHVDLLLASLTLQQHQQIPPPTGSTAVGAATTLWIKTSHKAIAKFSMVPNNAGASAIFKLFTARPQLFEKRLKRPPAATATADEPQNSNKRRRL